jgi:uncharacterized membrane protein
MNWTPWLNWKFNRLILSINTFLILHFSIGTLLLGISYLFKRFHPGKINHFYGYRTPRSMRSLKAWNCANRYSANLFIIVSALTCVFQVIAYSLMAGESSLIATAVFVTVGFIAVIPLTEIHLKKKKY